MKNKQYQYTYGRPVATSIFLVAYSLVWLGIFIFFALTSGGGCSLAWIMLLPLTGWLATTAVLAVVSVVLLWRYIRRIRYLKSRQAKVPKSYILTLALLPVALSSLFWIIPIIQLISPLTADTKMNTIQEFRQAAQVCEIESVGTYYNDTFHRAEDANAYVRVVTTEYLDYGTLYYSLNQKDELRQIYQEYEEDCAERIAERAQEYADYYYSTDYYKVDWSNKIDKYNTSC